VSIGRETNSWADSRLMSTTSVYLPASGSDQIFSSTRQILDTGYSIHSPAQGQAVSRIYASVASSIEHRASSIRYLVSGIWHPASVCIDKHQLFHHHMHRGADQ
jgi:hypothetical protein